MTYKKKQSLNDFFLCYNKKNKEENSIIVLKANMKVEICWENEQCDL